MSKTRVLILAGGQSDEHPVSLTSARSVLAALENTSLDATAVIIGRDGRWLSVEESLQVLAGDGPAEGGASVLSRAEIANDFDVVFPILHGPNGEDGTIQGILELAGIPYVGSGVLASSLCMDKAMSKDVLAHHGFSQVPYELVQRHTLATGTVAILDRLTQRLEAPWFVKPANLGSSIGISKATDRQSLAEALQLAARHDRRIVVEQGVKGLRELEVALIGNEDVQASPVGEIRYASEFYDYETKYTEGRATLHIPAEIPEAVSEQIRSEARRAFSALDCAGFARIDYFYEPANGTIYLNEVNTIPGFTPFSMFTKLWEATGMRYGQVIERLVELALERARDSAER